MKQAQVPSKVLALVLDEVPHKGHWARVGSNHVCTTGWPQAGAVGGCIVGWEVGDLLISEGLEGINDGNLVMDDTFLDTELHPGNGVDVECTDRFGILLGCS